MEPVERAPLETGCIEVTVVCLHVDQTAPWLEAQAGDRRPLPRKCELVQLLVVTPKKEIMESTARIFAIPRIVSIKTHIAFVLEVDLAVCLLSRHTANRTPSSPAPHFFKSFTLATSSSIIYFRSCQPASSIDAAIP